LPREKLRAGNARILYYSKWYYGIRRYIKHMNGRRGKAPRDHGNRGRRRIGIHIRGKHGGATAYYHRLERE
jgi:hypothetical protein